MNPVEAKQINYAAPNQQRRGLIVRPQTERDEARLTALFRVYLREEFPDAEDSYLSRWRWTDQPEYCFENVHREQPGHPGQASIERMHVAIRQNRTREGPLASILPIRWRRTSHD